ncbi:YgaP family membrane protein [Neisseria shayeganii]|uniref:Inner membrane protein YgaP-like transmembrane domain-containing protein n=2 Tax=Neisseria shayeganii TaxID=607712 RepID=G4CGH5_9NEIS|nr:DUF2892 domain-containing protein [Neisseria shayeganii]EGY53087.1 hypothetical protein HMPREF9371_0714 [Neisseria shayeganii 871]QMT39859.1 DUF2892 domain-containing protein [Neisseria shayeganii]
MNSNLGQADRLLRLIAGIALIALSLTGVIGVWGWIGIIFVATALINFCPIYRLLGISTKK